MCPAKTAQIKSTCAPVVTNSSESGHSTRKEPFPLTMWMTNLTSLAIAKGQMH